MKRKVLGLMMILVFLSMLGFGQDFPAKRASIGFRGGYYMSSASTFNNTILPIYNEGLSNKMSKIGGNATVGGEIEVFFAPRLSIAAVFEYGKQTLTGGGTAADSSYKRVIKLAILPIYGSLRYNFIFPNYRIYVGAGMGNYLGKVRMETTIQNVMNYTYSTADGIVPHIGAGFEYNLGGNLAVAVNLHYGIKAKGSRAVEKKGIQMGYINDFQIKMSSIPIEVSRKLVYIDKSGNEKRFEWDLDGLDFGVFLRYKF